MLRRKDAVEMLELIIQSQIVAEDIEECATELIDIIEGRREFADEQADDYSDID